MDNEFILLDRLDVIRKTIEKYGEENFYISFSGGKDSTILHHLIDLALPNNNIPRVFINTGIEYIDMVKHIKELSKKDNRIIIYNSNVNITNMLKKYGYPFKSKSHSHKVNIYQNSGYGKTVKQYVEGIRPTGEKSIIVCPNILKYQFTNENKLKISDKCCDKLKKEPIHRYEKESNRKIPIIGVRMSEGGNRMKHKGCTIFDGKKLKKFKPINPCTDEWCEWFIKKYNVKLCKLYYSPFNFKRIGCAGCPFSLNIKKELDIAKQLLPIDYKRSIFLWKPVYDEYRRIGYRLKDKEIDIYDFL